MKIRSMRHALLCNFKRRSWTRRRLYSWIAWARCFKFGIGSIRSFFRRSTSATTFASSTRSRKLSLTWFTWARETTAHSSKTSLRIDRGGTWLRIRTTLTSTWCGHNFVRMRCSMSTSHSKIAIKRNWISRLMTTPYRNVLPVLRIPTLKASW